MESCAKAHKLPNADTAVTNDPMEATWVGMQSGAQAVEKAKSTDVDKVRAAMAGQTYPQRHQDLRDNG